jgi:hypothetical protein
MGTLGGLAVIVVIVLVAGLIAYIGDRVGHQVGRKRMTLFGLRPKYTSTIVAVGTGMMIALVVTLTTLLASGYARAAFFHLSEINNRVNELQAQADALERVRNSNIVVTRGQPLYNQFLIINAQESPHDRYAALAAFFDAIVAALNKRYVPLGLRPFNGKASDPVIAAKLQAVLDDQTTQGFLLRGAVLLVAVADQNLFANDPIRFTFAPYADQPIFRNRQAITSVEIDGGTAINPNIAYGQLVTAIRGIAISSGMPAFFATVLPSLTAADVARTTHTIRSGRGRFFIVARATSDVFPHTGDIPVAFDLSRTPK